MLQVIKSNEVYGKFQYKCFKQGLILCFRFNSSMLKSEN